MVSTTTHTLVGIAMFVVCASTAHAGRNDYNFKLGAFSENPAVVQSAIAAEANDLKRKKQEREDEKKQAQDDSEFFSRTTEAGVISIITQRIQSEDSGEASSGNEIIRWSTSGGIRTVSFIDATTGQVKRTITFSVL